MALIQCPAWDVEFPPYAIALLSAILKERGYDVRCFDFNREFYAYTSHNCSLWDHSNLYGFWQSQEELSKLFMAQNKIINDFLSRLEPYDVLGFSMQSLNSLFTLQFIKKIKNLFPDKIIVAGGPDCFRNFNAEYLMRSGFFDALCIGEGDKAFPEFLDKICAGDNQQTPGFLIKNNNGVIDCGDIELLQDLDSLPFADFTFLDTSARAGCLSTSRGCINRCNFCQERGHWWKYRFRSADSIIKELVHLKKDFSGLEFVYFNDSLINGNMKEFNNFCDAMISNHINIRWGGHILVRKELTKEFLRKMKLAGADRLNFGIESGSDHVLKLMNKSFNSSLALQVLRNTKDAGISFSVNLIVGYPGETEEDFKQTQRLYLNFKQLTENIYVNPCYVLKGSGLYERHEEFGIELTERFVTDWLSKDGSNNPVIRKQRVDKISFFNICILSREYPPDTAWGGIGTYTYNLTQGLVAAGQKVHVICQSMDVDREYDDNGVHVHRVSHKSFFPFKGGLREFGLRWEYSQSVYNKLKEIIDKYEIDIVEAPNFSGEGFIYSFHKKTPLVTRLHTHFSEVMQFLGWKKGLDMRLSSWFEDIVILRSDLITCSTKAHAELISREVGIPKEKICIIPLGVDLPILNGNIETNHNSTVLYVGRLEKRKGVDDLIQAIPKVLKEVPLATFLIVGRDSFIKEKEVSFSGEREYSYKEHLIMMLPLEYRDRVKFLGYVSQEELDAYFRSCDLFVAPSLYESFGFIYIEAMSYAKPVIGCTVGGVPEVIKDKETGVLVPPQDPHRLAIEIISLLKDSTRRLEMGIAGRKDAEHRFSCESMVKNTLKAYAQICTRAHDKAR